MAGDENTLVRRQRTREQDPRSAPWPLEGEADLVVVDTTWGELQPMTIEDVRTVGELEVIELVEQGATLVDCRTRGSFNGVTLPGSVLLPHDVIAERRGELDPDRVAVLFCNGPQCPQSPDALRQLLAAGIPASRLAYYRGGLHDWVTVALPTEPRED